MTEVDDIQSFITAQKKRIEEERAGLAQANVGRRNVSIINNNRKSILKFEAVALILMKITLVNVVWSVATSCVC